MVEITTLSVCFTRLDELEGFDDDHSDEAKLDEEEAYELDRNTVFNLVVCFFFVLGSAEPRPPGYHSS